jgi:hypothetical protein
MNTNISQNKFLSDSDFDKLNQEDNRVIEEPYEIPSHEKERFEKDLEEQRKRRLI